MLILLGYCPVPASFTSRELPITSERRNRSSTLGKGAMRQRYYTYTMIPSKESYFKAKLVDKASSAAGDVGDVR